MTRILRQLLGLAGLCIGCIGPDALAQKPQALHALGDTELEQVSGSDGISLAMHLELNDPAQLGAASDSRISFGTKVDGQATYIVIKNLRGTVDMFSTHLSVQKKPDGGCDYVAILLPAYTKYTNFGFESLSVQTDPLAPVTESRGRLNLNGTVSMQGQLRLWAH